MMLLSLLLLFCSSNAASSTVVAAHDNRLAGLNSSQWEVRRDAFERLVAPPHAVKDPRTVDRILGLQEKEDVECEKVNPDLYEDDDYLAYNERLARIVEAIATETHQRRAWRALLLSRYNSGSDFGKWFADHPEALPEVEALVASPYGPRRSNGVYLVAAILAKNKNSGTIPHQTYLRLKQLIRFHMLNDIVPVKYDAVRGLGLIADPEDAAFLERYAVRCTDPTIRKEALDQARVIRSAQSDSQ